MMRSKRYLLSVMVCMVATGELYANELYRWNEHQQCISRNNPNYQSFKSTSPTFLNLFDCIDKGGKYQVKTQIDTHNQMRLNEWPNIGNDQYFVKRILQETTAIPLTVIEDTVHYNGLWTDPLSGQQFTDSSNLSLVNIVSVEYAKRNGATLWSSGDKQKFTSDYANIILIDKELALKKQDSSPAFWQPTVNRCAYIVQYNNVVNKYDLSYPIEESQLIAKLVRECQIQ